jgi:hypothetical protein
METSAPPVATIRPTPTPNPLPTDSVSGRAADPLILTLPQVAGGVKFDWVRVVGEGLFEVGHPVDDVLRAIDKERGDAVAVFKSGQEPSATIGATAVPGIDGGILLEAFVDTWHAPAVIHRWTRVIGGSEAWELAQRRGLLTVVYRRGDVVYLVEASDPSRLDAILSDMPPPGQ